jgi:hypothetical protein
VAVITPEGLEALRELVPEHLRDGLQLYVERGVEPGGFLCAVLENDLFGAFRHGSESSLRGIHGLCMWIYNYAPRPVWGDRATRLAWQRLNAEARRVTP